MKRLTMFSVVPLLALALIISAPVAALASANPTGPFTVTSLNAPTLQLSGIAPGDSTQWAVEIRNNAAVAKSLVIDIRDPASGKLTENDANGLWLRFSLCRTRLIATDRGGVRTFSCPVAPSALGLSPAGSQVTGSLVATIAAGDSLDVLVTVFFAGTSGNTFQNSTGALNLAIVEAIPNARSLTPLAFNGPDFSGLAFTGADVIGAVGAALVTFAVGFLMLVMSRRHRRRTRRLPETANWGGP